MATERRKGYLKGYRQGRKFDKDLKLYVLFGIAVGVAISLVALVIGVSL